MHSDEHITRRQRPTRGPGEKRFRCVECGGHFLASCVYDDDGEVICEECFDDTTEQESGIEVRASTFVLSLFALLATPRVVIDGREYPLGWWSSRFFPLDPGRHRIRLYVNHLFGEMGTQSAEVRVRPNRTRKVDYSYYVWWLPTQLHVR